MLAILVLLYAGMVAMPSASPAGAERLTMPGTEAPPQHLAQAQPAIPSPPPVAAPAAPPPATPAPDAAAVREELQLWTTIKDTNRPEEIEAFLLAYPNGRLASLARRRLDEVRRGAAAPPRPPVQAQPSAPPVTAPQSPAQALMAPAQPPPAAAPAVPTAPAEPFILTRAIITEIQERLYGLNYYSGPINGNFGKQTADAITAFQQRTGMTADGAIDRPLLERLRAARSVSIWGAVAFSARGAWGAAWAKPTRKIAETEAMAICRRNARTACKIVATPGSACTALSTYDVRGRNGRRFWGAYVATRSDTIESRDTALNNCRKDSPSPDACEIAVIICGDKGQAI